MEQDQKADTETTVESSLDEWEEKKTKNNESNGVSISSNSILHQVITFSSLTTQRKNETVWAQHFDDYFISNPELTKLLIDDLLYYVPLQPEGDQFFVRRRETKGLPQKGDPRINWEESFLLNVLLHHFEYEMEVSIRIKVVDEVTKKKKLKVTKKVTKKVYASPNKVQMDKKKAESVSLTYPFLYFAIDDFNETWKDISLNQEGELVCVELFAVGDFFTKPNPIRARLFAGALDYDVIRREYINKKWLWTSSSVTHFFNLKGPGGRGAAQMAVCSNPIQQPINSKSAQNQQGWLSWGTSQLKKLSFNTKHNSLNCSLTTLSMKWDQILGDILVASKSNANRSQ